ncbi:MAG: hypothetical protein ACW99A_14145 [Candidatus Kariarchaeaceae archaeon]|jgi:hypothetical protein
MSKFVKKASKGVADLGADAMKKAFGAVLGDIVKEILDETGATSIAKEKMMATGFKVIKELGIDPKNVQRDLIKNAIKNELKLK